jgi:hypothetical protein
LITPPESQSVGIACVYPMSTGRRLGIMEVDAMADEKWVFNTIRSSTESDAVGTPNQIGRHEIEQHIRYVRGHSGFDREAIVDGLLGDICEQTGRLGADVEGNMSHAESAKHLPPKPPPRQLVPLKKLHDWDAICEAVGHPTNDKDTLKRLARRADSPIQTKRGSPPMVEREALIKWWNALTLETQESENQRLGREASVSTSYRYGRDGTVLPEISGHEKKRRQPPKK